MSPTKRLEWLEIQLDTMELTHEQFKAYNDEANEIQAEINAIKAQREADRQTLEDKKIQHITQLAAEGRMVELVETYGGEFEANYIITENFTVMSSCFNPRNPNGQNVWEFTCIEDALAKKFQLIYYRVYDRYVRDEEAA
jgi:hypothetical protein